MKLKLLLSALFSSFLSPVAAATKSSNGEVYWEETDNGQITFFADNPHIIPQWVDIRLTGVKRV